MEMINARNPQTAMLGLRAKLAARRSTKGDLKRLPGPLAVHYARPTERVVYWPELKRKPAEELREALMGVAQVGQFIQPMSERLGPEHNGFHLVANLMALRLHVETTDQHRLHAFASLVERDPLVGVMGQMMLQLSIIQELTARAAGVEVGALTIVQSEAVLTDKGSKALFPEGGHYNSEWNDPYTLNLVTPTPIEGTTDELLEDFAQFAEVGSGAIGYKSQFLRRVVVPLAQNDPDQVKAADWRRALELA